jgi:excisionase family DNA binding protein
MARVIAGLFNDQILRHPHTVSQPDLMARALAISDALGDFHHLVDGGGVAPSQDLPAVLTIAALADRWGISTSTVTAEIKAGRLRAFRLGKLYRIRRDAALEYERSAAIRLPAKPVC